MEKKTDRLNVDLPIITKAKPISFMQSAQRKYSKPLNNYEQQKNRYEVNSTVFSNIKIKDV